jgi:hypothetical protein
MFTIKIDSRAALAVLNDIQKTQLPFAMAAALTQTAKDGQGAMQTRMSKIFTLRNTWTQQGMKITPARKTDQQPFSEVIADRWYLGVGTGSQEVGGARIPHEGHDYIAVPLRINLGVSQTSLIPTHLRPKNLINSGKGFIVTLRDGRKFIFMRTGPEHNAIAAVYRLISEVLLKPVLDLEDTIAAIVTERWDFNFQTAIDKAVITTIGPL